MAAALPMIMTIGSGVMAANSAAQQGQAAANAADYNTKIANQNAEIAAAQSSAAAGIQQRDTELKMGTAMANYGASGVQMATGSPSDVLASSARNAALNGLTLKYNYLLQGLGYKNQAALDIAQAANDRIGARASAAAQLMGAAGKAINQAPTGGGTAIPEFGDLGGNPQQFT